MLFIIEIKNIHEKIEQFILKSMKHNTILY